MRLLFLHGWGFDAGVWDALRRALPGHETIARDRGYFGAPRAARVAGPFIAVGHSLGALLLAADPPPGCAGLIAINGFDRFAGEDAVPARVVTRMRRRFAEAPGEVLATFRARCGASPAAGTIDVTALGEDLDRLATGDARGCAPPLLLLHGADDPILPAPMRAATFAGAPRHSVAGGGHLLPLTHPGWCADHIRAVLL